MPFIKRYPDGSVFDYTHGHRTAEQVARQQAEGKYEEPSSFQLKDTDPKKVLGSAVLLGATVLFGGLIWGISSHFAYEHKADELVSQKIEERLGAKVLDSENDDIILIRLTQSSDHSENETAEEHASHTAITSCTDEEFKEDGKQFVVVMCENVVGSLTVELPSR